jgi:hypothetical protein
MYGYWIGKYMAYLKSNWTHVCMIWLLSHPSCRTRYYINRHELSSIFILTYWDWNNNSHLLYHGVIFVFERYTHTHLSTRTMAWAWIFVGAWTYAYRIFQFLPCVNGSRLHATPFPNDAFVLRIRGDLASWARSIIKPSHPLFTRLTTIAWEILDRVSNNVSWVCVWMRRNLLFSLVESSHSFHMA